MRLISRRTSLNSDGLHCAAYNQLTGCGPEAITQKNEVHTEDRKAQLQRS